MPIQCIKEEDEDSESRLDNSNQDLATSCQEFHDFDEVQ
jgi:hypothetical protein